MTDFAQASSPTIDARVEFYSGAGAPWPRNWYRHTFAAWIVHRTGRLMYGRDWTGTEPETILVYPLPARLDSSTRPDEVQWAIKLLCRFHQAYFARWLETIGKDEPAPHPTPDEWAFAFGLARQISDDAWSAYSRFRTVVELLVSLLERGLLRAALRPFFLGEPEELPPGAWFNEYYHAWFATCQIDVERPFSGVPVRKGGHWIVFNSDDFDAWEASVRKATAKSPTATSAGVSQDNATPANDEPSAGATDTTPVKGTDRYTGDADDSADTGRGSLHCSKAMAEPAARAGEGRFRKKPGAKARYPWYEGPFEAEILRRMTSTEKPTSMHQFADLMLAWSSEHWPAEPSKTRMRERIAEILAKNGVHFR